MACKFVYCLNCTRQRTLRDRSDYTPLSYCPMSTVIPCEPGVFDCSYAGSADDAVCADYNNEYLNMEGRAWVVIISGYGGAVHCWSAAVADNVSYFSLVMCIMSFGIGANDVSNAWGTSVGSGALSLRTAVALGGIGDFLGAVTLGHGVSDKIAKGVSDVTDEDCWACGYCDSKMSLYQVGMFSALCGASFLLIAASYLGLPVSSTHASIGGVVGMTMLSIGPKCINWSLDGVGAIFLSWMVAPVLSGVISAVLYVLTDRAIFRSQNPRDRAVAVLPWFFSSVTWIMLYLIMVKSGSTKEMKSWIQILIASVGGVSVFVASILVVSPYVQRTMPSGAYQHNDAMMDNSKSSNGLIGSSGDSSKVDAFLVVSESVRPEETSDGSSQSSHGILASVPQKSDDEVGPLPNSGSEYSKLSLDSKAENCLSPADNSAQLDDAMYCFKYLLVFNAFLESFSHGANDTANSTAPFSAVYSVYYHGEDACEKISSNAWIMILAGIFVAIGVITYGEKVIVTVGEKLTKIDYQKGFCIEFSSCVTVVIATILHLPVSTTHCQIGSVVFVGLVSLGYKHVCWSAVGSILIAWFVTVPIAATVAVIVTSLVQQWL